MVLTLVCTCPPLQCGCCGPLLKVARALSECLPWLVPNAGMGDAHKEHHSFWWKLHILPGVETGCSLVVVKRHKAGESLRPAQLGMPSLACMGLMVSSVTRRRHNKLSDTQEPKQRATQQRTTARSSANQTKLQCCNTHSLKCTAPASVH